MRFLLFWVHLFKGRFLAGGSLLTSMARAWDTIFSEEARCAFSHHLLPVLFCAATPFVLFDMR